MTLISIIICLFTERFLNELSTARNYAWYKIYSAQLIKTTKFLSSKTVVLLIVLPVPLIVAFVDYKFIQNPILQFLFATTLLLLSMGPKPFYEITKDFCNTYKKEETDVAQWLASKLLNRDLTTEEQENLAFTFVRSLFIIANDRILGPIFWFIILGPMGALFFRLSSELRYLCKRNEAFIAIKPAANLLHAILNWIPARLTAFGYAAMGNFVTAINHCKKDENIIQNLSLKNNQRILYSAGIGALEKTGDKSSFSHADVIQTLSLIRRSYALLLGILALLTLAGWII